MRENTPERKNPVKESGKTVTTNRAPQPRNTNHGKANPLDNIQTLLPTETQTTWIIGTHNTRGFNDKIKQIALLNFCRKEHIDIMGITKTWLSPNHKITDEEEHYKI